MKRLKLNHIPPFLFHDKHFTQYKTKLVCNYKTKDPQSYFINPYFLFMNAPVRAKIVYIKALAMRRIAEQQDYIPLKYFSEIKPNPFLRVEDDKILFPLEAFVRNNPTHKN